MCKYEKSQNNCYWVVVTCKKSYMIEPNQKQLKDYSIYNLDLKPWKICEKKTIQSLSAHSFIIYVNVMEMKIQLQYLG